MKKFVSLLLSALLVAGLAACGGNDAGTASLAEAPAEPVAEEVSAEVDEENEADEEEAPAAEGTVLVSHEYGEAEVPVNPEKVIVLDFGVLDILDTVGVVIGGLPASNLPGYLEKFEGDEYLNVGNLKEVDFEKIAEYAPDVIFISGRLSSTYDEMSEIAPTVYLATGGADYMSTFGECVDVLGRIFPDKAAEIKAAYDGIVADAAALKADAEASGLKALVVMANDGNISFFGSGSRYGVIYDDFGFAPAAEDIESSTHGAEGSFEFFTEVDPDVIFVIDRSAAISAEGATGAATLLDNDLVNATAAAQNGKIVYLSSDIWYTAGGGLYSTAAMIEEVASALD